MSRAKSDRLVLIIDSDPILSERLRAVLANYQFSVQLFADGNDLLSGPQLFPELIVLCIDPKRLGWALCNRVKKTAQYGSIPMIVSSAEATEKDFEEHRKLRTRAEDYLLKPFSVEELLRRVSALVGLVPADEVESVDENSIEELSVDDAIVEEEELGAGAKPTNQPFGGPGELDDDFDLETESAFAALGAPSTASSRASATSPARAPTPVPKPSFSQLRAATGTKTPEPGSAPAILPTETAVLDGPTREFKYDGGSDMDSMRRALDVAQRRLEDALSETAHWHELRDQLASERDFLVSERDRVLREKNELSKEQAAHLSERDNLVAERNHLLIERNGLALEAESLKARASADTGEYAAKDAKWTAERDQLVRERDQLLNRCNEATANQSVRDHQQTGFLAEQDKLRIAQKQLEQDRGELERQLEVLGAERKEVAAEKARFEATRTALAAEQTQLAEKQRLIEEKSNELSSVFAQKELQSRTAWDSEVARLQLLLEQKEKDAFGLRLLLGKREEQTTGLSERVSSLETEVAGLLALIRVHEREKTGLGTQIDALVAERDGLSEREKSLQQRLEESLRKFVAKCAEFELLQKLSDGEPARQEEALAQQKRQLAEEHERHVAAATQELERVGRELAAQVRGAEEVRRQTLGQIEAQFHRQFSEQVAMAEKALENEQRLHEQRMKVIEQEHRASYRALSVEHEQVKEQAKDLAERLERTMRIAAETQEGMQQKIVMLAKQLEVATGELVPTQNELLMARNREASMTQTVSNLEDQTRRAYQQLLADEDQLNRVRRALQIALAITEENDGQDEGSSQTPMTLHGESPSSATPKTDL